MLDIKNLKAIALESDIKGSVVIEILDRLTAAESKIKNKQELADWHFSMRNKAEKERDQLRAQVDSNNSQEPDWKVCESLADNPTVHEAYIAFSDDPTQDQATILAQEIIKAYLQIPPKPKQDEAVQTTPAESVQVVDREYLGKIVRDVWIAWAIEQPNPKQNWLLPYADLTEPDKEVDRRIGETLYRLGSKVERVSGDDIPTFDLDKLSWAAIKQAACESKWMPPDYMANDWEYDVCEFLRNGHVYPSPNKADEPVVHSQLEGFICYLIDKEEGSIIDELTLQHQLAGFIKSPRYNRKSPTNKEDFPLGHAIEQAHKHGYEKGLRNRKANKADVWKPIETVTKQLEFRCILAHEFSVTVGYWNGFGWVNERSKQPLPHCYFSPTHWMPLPLPPLKDEG